MRRPTLRGFSLIELLVVLAIAAILLGVGVPGFRSILQRQRMATAVNDLFVSMNLARSEAIQRGARVDLVPADGKRWASGWIVFVDRNGDRLPDAGDTVIFSKDAVPSGVTIVATLGDSSGQYLSYNGAGRTRTDASNEAPQFGTWSFIQDGTVKRRIKVGFLGRARVCDPVSDSTCTGTTDTK